MNQLSPLDDNDVGKAPYEQPQCEAWADRFGEALLDHARGHGISIPDLSLFSDAGGLDIGFHDVGFHIQHAVEIEKTFSDSIIKPNENSSKEILSFSLGVVDDVAPAVNVIAVDGRSQSENYLFFDPTSNVQYDDRVVFIHGINLLQIEIGGLA